MLPRALLAPRGGVTTSMLRGTLVSSGCEHVLLGGVLAATAASSASGRSAVVASPSANTMAAQHDLSLRQSHCALVPSAGRLLPSRSSGLFSGSGSLLFHPDAANKMRQFQTAFTRVMNPYVVPMWSPQSKTRKIEPNPMPTVLTYDRNYEALRRERWIEGSIRVHYVGLWKYRVPRKYTAELDHMNKGEFFHRPVRGYDFKNGTGFRRPRAVGTNCRMHYFVVSTYDYAATPKFVLYSKMYLGWKVWMMCFRNGMYALYWSIWCTVSRNDVVHTKSHRVEQGSVWRVGQLPFGTLVSLVELYPNGGMQSAIAPGTRCTVLGMGRGVFGEIDRASEYTAADGMRDLVPLQLPSRAVRLVDPNCLATVGVRDGIFHNFSFEKDRYRREAVRRTAMTKYKQWHMARAHPAFRKTQDDPIGKGRSFLAKPWSWKPLHIQYKRGVLGRHIKTRI
eukprot:TRINITY_DN2896_c0_g1_i1.p1 TRINITY_DN2896_c0_g1~~TRINITY_DN2896_c0_g1_i1.p1  ORF type:complete len:450 (-),score=57.60 TRINITY_DN2896_c0_g1_i1:68-1417(-)